MAIDLEKIGREIRKGKDIEDIIEQIDWKEFENLCSKILEENGWKTKSNFRFKTDKRYEIDILAEKGNRNLLIDCKHWGLRPGKSTQLKYAAQKQIERASELSKIKFLDKTNKKMNTHPIIITLLQEDIISEQNVFVVPLFKLNAFLLEIENYLG